MHQPNYKSIELDEIKKKYRWKYENESSFIFSFHTSTLCQPLEVSM